MSNYSDGRRFEWKVRDDLETNGYRVLRTAGSKGAVDLIAHKPGDLVFVQVKRWTGTISPKARADLLDWADTGTLAHPHPGTAVVAYQPAPRRPILYRRLTGPGPKDWQPWTPDWAVTP